MEREGEKQDGMPSMFDIPKSTVSGRGRIIFGESK